MFYDVRFDAIAPKSADSTEQEEVIRLIINVEAQTKFKPGWESTVLDITSGNHGKESSTAMNRIVFCLHNCFMRNMNYTHAVWEGRNGCVNLFTCCEMKQCFKNNARTHKKSIKIW